MPLPHGVAGAPHGSASASRSTRSSTTPRSEPAQRTGQHEERASSTCASLAPRSRTSCRDRSSAPMTDAPPRSSERNRVVVGRRLVVWVGRDRLHRRRVLRDVPLRWILALLRGLLVAHVPHEQPPIGRDPPRTRLRYSITDGLLHVPPDVEAPQPVIIVILAKVRVDRDHKLHHGVAVVIKLQLVRLVRRLLPHLVRHDVAVVLRPRLRERRRSSTSPHQKCVRVVRHRRAPFAVPLAASAAALRISIARCATAAFTTSYATSPVTSASSICSFVAPTGTPEIAKNTSADS